MPSDREEVLLRGSRLYSLVHSHVSRRHFLSHDFIEEMVRGDGSRFGVAGRFGGCRESSQINWCVENT
jgi:hypothetical protein